MTTKSQLTQWCVDNYHPVQAVSHSFFSGVSHFMFELIGGVVIAAIGFGLGWYVKGRGVTGVKTDLGNAETTVKTDIAAL